MPSPDDRGEGWAQHRGATSGSTRGSRTFATYLWVEHVAHINTFQNLKLIFGVIPAKDPFWKQSIADPKRDTMLSFAVYYRGAMTLAALRAPHRRPGFFTLLRRWATEHRNGNVTTAQFVGLAEEVSGQDLHRFFQIWLWNQVKPSSFDAG